MPYHIIGKRLPVKLVWMREPDFVSLGCLVPRMGLRASWAILHNDPWRDDDGHSVRHKALEMQCWAIQSTRGVLVDYLAVVDKLLATTKAV